MDVQSPETPGFLSLRLEVYSPPQVLQIHGRLCHLVLAFLIMEKLQTEGPLCSADITLLHRSYGPIRHPLAVDRFPGWYPSGEGPALFVDSAPNDVIGGGYA